MTDLRAFLLDRLSEEFDVPREQVTDSATLHDLGLDSLSLQVIGVLINEELGTNIGRIDELSLESTIGDVIAAVDARTDS